MLCDDDDGDRKVITVELQKSEGNKQINMIHRNNKLVHITKAHNVVLSMYDHTDASERRDIGSLSLAKTQQGGLSSLRGLPCRACETWCCSTRESAPLLPPQGPWWITALVGYIVHRSNITIEL